MTPGASPRERGDYFERQAKAALEANGWWVIRAAGSHGAADLVAHRAGFKPLFISCKVSGSIGPRDRSILLAASAVGGATPLMAQRPRRGVVALHLVLDGPHMPLVDELTTPPKE